ncbi:cytochrome b-c1 complex subunit 2, mitochondrial [Prorops nasuta]|uniref:cytochrome b-c1 complex subunit 2, mitochondrial n=1 Tax=Prorops nasuta TaxID=863751 RepID=UPI0034CD1754
MACTAVRTPLLRNTSVRHYAAAAVAQAASQSGPEVQVLDNKITIAALDCNSPITYFSVIFRAGSRNETYDTQGLNHYLRTAAGLTTSRSSAFAITRNIQQLGANLITSSNRETTTYTLQCTRDNIAKALNFLEDVTTKQVFKPWEISDQIPRMRYELSTLPETTRILELLHKAAYRTGLGYSLYAPKRQLGKICDETLKHFVNTYYNAPRCSVVAVGLPLPDVKSFAVNCDLEKCDNGQNEKSKFIGGEIRKERNSDLATVAIAVESAGLNNLKEAIAWAVFAKAAGTGPRIKWGSSIAPLSKTLASAGKTELFGVTSLNTTYSDSGLTGVIFSAEGSRAGELTQAAYKWLRSPNLSDADVARGKNELKLEVCHAVDSLSHLHENIIQQLTLTGRVTSPLALATEIDKITPSDVKSVASKCCSGKLAMAAIGNLSTVPFIENLN